MHKFKDFLLVCVFILVSFPAQARIIHVPSDSSTIQKGINGAVYGDTVLVAPGTYYEHINFLNKQILLKSEVGPESTIISKAHNDTSIVTFSSGEGVLEGFTITGGNLTANDSHGGGIYCGYLSTPRIVGNIIRNNNAAVGGGVYLGPNGSPNLINNIILENSAAEGAGIYSDNDNRGRTEGNLVLRNNAINHGGGLYVSANHDTILIKNNTFHQNSANLGGGIYSSNPNPVVKIKNNIISGTLQGYGFACAQNSSPIVTYNDFWNNQPLDIGGASGCSAGIGCIFTNPYYCNADSDNYNLQNISPCWGAGEYGETIGAYSNNCGDYQVTITSVSDVRNDQGKQVSIKWSSFPGNDPLVTDFSVFRRRDYLLTLSSPDFAVDKSLLLTYPPGEWDWLVTIPAFGETLYSVIVPTLKDSTISEGMYWSYFFVRAGTDNPTVYFDSPVDSGYSLDNLSPSPPIGLLAFHKPAVTRLIWKKSVSVDFDYYTLYRDTSSQFQPSPNNKFAFSIDSVFTDSTAQLGEPYYYLVSATDFSGNESNQSNEAMGIRYTVGDANTDGKVSVSDIIYLINYLFRSGSSPRPVEAGNVNCENQVNITDVVYLINYLFKGGKPPCET